jgi:hypothetical protein
MGFKKDSSGNDPIRDIVDGVGDIVGLAPGKAGYGLDGAARYLKAGYSVDDEKKFLREAGIDLQEIAPYSKAAIKKLQSLEDRPNKVLRSWGAEMVGAIAGGTAGAVVLGPLFPFAGTLIGGLAGAAGGGYTAGKIYNDHFETTEQDGVGRAACDYCKIRQHKKITEVEAFATLLAALPERAQKPYEDMLADSDAGTRNFAEAAESKEGQKVLRKLMSNPRLQDIMRHYYHIPEDDYNPTRHVADQYAELVNSGEVDARMIIMKPQLLRVAAERHYMQVLQFYNSNTQEFLWRSSRHASRPILPTVRSAARNIPPI